MLASRLRVAIVLILVGVTAVILGGYFYLGLVAAMLGVAAWEFGRLFAAGGFSPAVWLLVPGVVLITVARYFWGFVYQDAILAGLVLISMVFHTIKCGQGCKTSAVDFTITIGGLLYLGWIGAYLISLRTMPDGQWWTLLAIPAIAIGDTGAYFFGRRFGKHKLAPNISPKKTVEGYIGGIFSTILGGILLAVLWSGSNPAMSWQQGLVLGAVLCVLAPVGDLGESMLKRQFNVKDSGKILAAHGGMLDRLDTWIWGGVLSYYLITFLW
jgi:phosphatidate cytidylyltransferase